jgi:cyclase
MASHVVPRTWKHGMVEIGPRVFAYVQASGIDPEGDTGIANAGLVIGRDGATAIDALMVPSMTRRLVAAIRKVTKKPVAKLVNTHHHLDHTGGNSFFKGSEIIATEKARAALAPGLPPLPLLQSFMPRFADEFAKIKVVLPHVTFQDHLVIYDGDRELQLWHPGTPAHTIGDTVVFLPKEKVLFAGDLCFHYVTPLGFQGHIGHWIKALDRLLEFDADVIVPGHGAIGAKQEARYVREYLVLVRREAKRRFDAGLSAEDAARDIKLGPFRAWSDAERILPNVMRCYAEFRGQPDEPLDLPRMLAGMQKLRGRPADHTCL